MKPKSRVDNSTLIDYADFPLFISEEIRAMPQIDGMGEVASLWPARLAA